MPFSVEEFRDLIRILEERPEWRAELRRLLLTDEILTLPQVVRQLAERVDGLAEQMRRLAERMDELAEQMSKLAQRMDMLAQQVSALVEWQKGEAGRREGERYERNTVKRAPMLFSGGVGGATDSPRVQERLSQWLRSILDGERFLEPDDDPTLSDLIWWKGEQVIVVEVSLKVNGDDVVRAFKRARTLQSAGVNANPVVIGEDWANLEARELAKEKGVWWLVGGIPSEGFVSFRRLPPQTEGGSQ